MKRMIKRTVVILAILGLAALTTHCTSADSKSEDGNEVVSSDDPSATNLEGAADPNSAPPADGTTVAEASPPPTDQLPEDALGDISAAPPTDANGAQEPGGADLALPAEQGVASAAPPEEGVAPGADLSMPGDPNTNLAATTPSPSESVSSSSTPDAGSAPPTTTDIASNNLPSMTSDIAPPLPDVGGGSATASVPASSGSVGLQKIASTPWKQGKKWINAVYFAHPNDTLESISEKIYGSGKSLDLSKVNPQYSSRALKPGDKVYYNSPQRPDDQEKILTYYEDNNVQSQSYTAKSGDTVKKVAKKVLGFDGAWKELWASNDLESKGTIPEGTFLRYWPYEAGSVSTPAPEKIAEAPAPVESAPAPAPAVPAPAEPTPNPIEPNAGNTVAENSPPPIPPAPEPPMPPPPPAGDPMSTPPPPPPIENPSDATAATPPPTPGEHGGSEGAPAAAEQEDPMVYAVLGLAGLAVVALIMIKKKRKQKELEQALNDTQVG